MFFFTLCMIFAFSFDVQPLPYESTALEPVISADTLSFHHGKHYTGYVNKLNNVDKYGDYDSLTDVMLETKNGKIYNLAAQSFNHEFYWASLDPEKKALDTTSSLSGAIIRDFKSFENFEKQWKAKAAGHFGSGWIWLIMNSRGQLKINEGHDAHCPYGQFVRPLLTLDVWEHAYYLDYQNGRVKYIAGTFNMLNWTRAAKLFEQHMKEFEKSEL